MRYCLTLDLKNDPELIAEYESHHQKVWPEIVQSFYDSGISTMEIYRWENRLFMIIDAEEGFSFEKKARADAENPIVQKWESLMSTYQEKLPGVKNDEKWQLMKNIFKV
jgi:L-rhamnose mutarotase